MLVGKTVKGCKKCYELEASGGLSGRQAGLIWFVPKENILEPLIDLEVAFSNLCNLACVGCGDLNSTKWSTENIKAGRKGLKLIDNKFNWQEWGLSKLQRLKILGGEPFMEPDRFCELLEKVDLPNIELTIYTNGTMLPNKGLKSLIEKCKKVNFLVSVDGLGTVNDWNRWPSKFNEVVDVMNAYHDWWSNHINIILTTHSIINIFNIFTMENYIDFMKSNYPTWNINFNWVHTPIWQSLKCLPDTVKNDLINNFSKKEFNDSTKIANFYKFSIEYLKMPSTISWDYTKEQTIKLATERGLDLNTMIPDFKKVMDN
jgi:sulfatase maturation enzyme AslB (radical SAM superfamily)